MKKIIVVSLVSLLLLIIIGEVSFRMFFYEQLKTREFDIQYQQDSLSYLYVPNTMGYLVMPSLNKKFRINNQGFLGPDFDKQKDKNVYRIIVTGASNVTGVWAEYEEEGVINFVTLTQSLFDKEGYNVEIINCAVDGATHLNILDLVKYRIPEYSPDLVLIPGYFPITFNNVTRENYKGYVIDYKINNYRMENEVKEYINLVENSYGFKFLYDNSFVFRAFCKKYSEKIPHKNPFSKKIMVYSQRRLRGYPYMSRYTMTESTLKMKEILSNLNENGIDSYLYSFSNDSSKLITFMNKHNFPNIALNIQFKRSDITQLSSHLNLKGHKKISEPLFIKLKEIVPISYKK